MFQLPFQFHHSNTQDATMTHNLFFPKKDTENGRSEIRRGADGSSEKSGTADEFRQTGGLNDHLICN